MGDIEKRSLDLKKEIKENVKNFENKLTEASEANSKFIINMEEKLDDFDKKIKNQVDYLISQKIDFSIKKFTQNANLKIDEFLDKDFSAQLEKRYLSMEYVLNGIWARVIPKIMDASIKNEYVEIARLWNNLFRSQLALRQLLSSDDIDIFTGLGTLKVLIGEKIIPKEYIWNLIRLLKEEGRLSAENEILDRQIGRDIGKRNFR